MKRSSLILPFLKYLFTRPSVILKALYHGVSAADRRDHVIAIHNKGNGLRQVDLLDLFPAFEEHIDNYTHLYGTSFPIDIALLKKLARGFTDCEYFEIGTWRGESISNISKVAKKCVSLSLSDSEMHKIGYGPEFTKVQRFFSKALPNVEHIEGNSMTFDYSSIGKFDLIFVDGDHRYEAVRSDTSNVFKLLKNENSIIVWHDYVTQYEFIDWNVLGGILDGCPDDKKDKIYHVKNTLCAIYIPWQIKSSVRVYPSVPDKTFSISFKVASI
jgi:hypothetical protein